MRILSGMENDFSGPSKGEAADALATLTKDRGTLAQNVNLSWPLFGGYGAVAAWLVTSAATTTPGEGYQPPIGGWLALAAVFVLTYLARRETGVRFRSMGTTGTWAMAGIVVACLVLFSVSLGLVASGIAWAVVFTGIAAFAVTTWLSRVAYHSAVAKLRHG